MVWWGDRVGSAVGPALRSASWSLMSFARRSVSCAVSPARAPRPAGGREDAHPVQRLPVAAPSLLANLDAMGANTPVAHWPRLPVAVRTHLAATSTHLPGLDRLARVWHGPTLRLLLARPDLPLSVQHTLAQTCGVSATRASADPRFISLPNRSVALSAAELLGAVGLPPASRAHARAGVQYWVSAEVARTTRRRLGLDPQHDAQPSDPPYGTERHGDLPGVLGPLDASSGVMVALACRVLRDAPELAAFVLELDEMAGVLAFCPAWTSADGALVDRVLSLLPDAAVVRWVRDRAALDVVAQSRPGVLAGDPARRSRLLQDPDRAVRLRALALLGARPAAPAPPPLVPAGGSVRAPVRAR